MLHSCQIIPFELYFFLTLKTLTCFMFLHILFYSIPCFIYSEASEATVTRVCEASCVQEMLVFSVRLKDSCDFAP